MEAVKLGDIATIVSGTTRPKTEKGNIPVYGGNGILGYTDVSNYGGPMICVGRVGAYCGIVSFEQNALWLSDNALGITTKQGTDIIFLRYLLEAIDLNRIHVGAAQPVITQGVLKNLPLKIPPLPEQKEIARTLTSIDDKISTNNKIIETSEKLMREIYNYWFVQFDFPDENSRPYKSSGGEMVYNETLKREIPKGWKVVNVEDLAQLTWGQCPDGANILEKDSKIPSLPYCSGAGDMDGGYIVSCQARTDNSRREVENGAILLSIAGTIGKMAIANEKISLGRATLGITPNDKKYYALVWLLLKMYNSRLKTASVGAVQKIINKSNIKELNIAIPSVADMDYEALNSAMETIKSLSLENNKLSSLRDWLLPMLMNGQIKVSD